MYLPESIFFKDSRARATTSVGACPYITYLEYCLCCLLFAVSLVLTDDGGRVLAYCHTELTLLVLEVLHLHLAVGVTHTVIPENNN